MNMVPPLSKRSRDLISAALGTACARGALGRDDLIAACEEVCEHPHIQALVDYVRELEAGVVPATGATP